MVLPLSPGQYPGQRAISTNGEVDETGSRAKYLSVGWRDDRRRALTHVADHTS
jgi:hypothetical protein